MCTLSFIPYKVSGFVLTSNRDESPSRETIPPDKYNMDGVSLWFPKDAKAGGTWLGISQLNRCVCLLNGGFEPHAMGGVYKKSRGIVVLDLLKSKTFVEALKEYDFDNIEPFTLIGIDWVNEIKIYELIWDGSQSHLTEKEIAPNIWSSALLYKKSIKLKREKWFESFMGEASTKKPEDILMFHKNAGDGDLENDLIMNRTFVKTKSITQIIFDEDKITMEYEDLEKEHITKSKIEI